MSMNVAFIPIKTSQWLEATITRHALKRNSRNPDALDVRNERSIISAASHIMTFRPRNGEAIMFQRTVPPRHSADQQRQRPGY
jgi:hypothetical protein